MKKFILTISCLFAIAPSSMAADVSQTYDVGPNDNGSRMITPTGAIGDRLKISFTPKEGYRFTKDTQRDDKTKAGWQRSGPHSFDVTCKADHRKEDQWAVFSGALRAITKEGMKGEPPPELPWKLDGFFKVLGEHEGVGDGVVVARLSIA